jgi:hypothetical protein
MPVHLECGSIGQGLTVFMPMILHFAVVWMIWASYNHKDQPVYLETPNHLFHPAPQSVDEILKSSRRQFNRFVWTNWEQKKLKLHGKQ